jgi:hypothetical protein
VNERLVPEPARLVGWHVAEVGVRQAWPFVTFCAPTGEATEKRLYIDTDFSVRGATGAEITGPPLNRIESVLMLTVDDVRHGADGLSFRFDDGSALTISAEPNAETTHDVWWFA